MKLEAEIDLVIIHECILQLTQPVEGAFQRHRERHALIVELRSGGLCGFGEVAVLDLPNYASEWAGGAKQLLCEIIGPRFLAEGKLSFRSLDWLVGNGASRFAVEGALVDLLAKQRNVGLTEFLGTLFSSDAYDAKRVVRLGGTVGALGGWRGALGDGERLVAGGARRLKIKVARDSLENAPWRDIADLGVEIILDFNGSLKFHELPLLRLIPPPFRIEEPSTNLHFAQYREVPRLEDNVIFWDESAVSQRIIEYLHDLNREFGVVIKPFRIGSLGLLDQLLNYLADHNVACYLGGMFETSVGRRMLVAMSSHSCFANVGDMGPSSWYYSEDVGNPVVTLPDNSGLSSRFVNGNDVSTLRNHRCDGRCVTLERLP